MSLNNTGAGFNWTNEYLSSALPWVTGSLSLSATTPTKLNFPRVTKYVKIRAQTGDVRLGFTVNGVSGSNYFVVSAGDTQTFDIRVNELYVRGDSGAAVADVFAGLTLIHARDGIPFLTGSTTNTTGGSDVPPGAGWEGVG